MKLLANFENPLVTLFRDLTPAFFILKIHRGSCLKINFGIFTAANEGSTLYNINQS
jgi:hypothetical protein